MWDKKEAQEAHFILSKVQESVREWVLTLPSELPLGHLESRWTPESSRSDCKSQNPLDWRVFYFIGKLLKQKCLKWTCMTHLDIWNTSYGQKKSQESNWQFDSQPLKVGNWSDFLAQVVFDIQLESFRRGLQLCFRPHLNQRSAHKVMGPKVAKIPILGISRRDKMPFGCGPRR